MHDVLTFMALFTVIYIYLMLIFQSHKYFVSYLETIKVAFPCPNQNDSCHERSIPQLSILENKLFLSIELTLNNKN